MKQENPDNIIYEGMTTEDTAVLVPTPGMLRFVIRKVHEDGTTQRILQQFQWSAQDRRQDWYDVPCLDEIEVDDAACARQAEDQDT